MNRLPLLLALPLLFFHATRAAQTGDAPPPVCTAFAVLTESLDAKSATEGQTVVLRTARDVLVNKVVVIPRGSRLTGRVVGAGAKGEGGRQATLSIVVDRAASKGGAEIPLQAIIAAVAAPKGDDSLADDPAYTMMHSNEPQMVGLGPGANSPASKSDSNAAAATADLKGPAEERLLLKEDSQGAIGYEGASISWQFTSAPPVTVFTSKGKSLKLKAGTQVLLRMAPPAPAK